jgi:hypothetical protein
MKKVILAILTIGMMVSCVEEPNKFVIVRRYDGNDTITKRIISVNKNFKIGDVIIPFGVKGDSVRFKIVEECRRRS